MTQIIHEANSKRWLLVEVPEGSQGFYIDESGNRLLWNDEYYEQDFSCLPTGNWQILGPGTADNIEEYEMEEICHVLFDDLDKPENEQTDGLLHFRNYETEGETTDSAESFASLLRHHNLHPATTVVLTEQP